MAEIKRRETMRAEMKPDLYGGASCDQVASRWWCFAVGDKQGDFEHEPLKLDARLFPPGTKITITEPVCPDCEEQRALIMPTPKVGSAFAAKCQCGFDWDSWTAGQYS